MAISLGLYVRIIPFEFHFIFYSFSRQLPTLAFQQQKKKKKNLNIAILELHKTKDTTKQYNFFLSFFNIKKLSCKKKKQEKKKNYGFPFSSQFQ